MKKIREHMLSVILWLILVRLVIPEIADAGAPRTISLQVPSVSKSCAVLDYGNTIVSVYKITLQRLELSTGDSSWVTAADGPVTVDVTDGSAGAQLRQWITKRELAAGLYRKYRITMDTGIDYKAAVKEKGSTRWWVTRNAGLGMGELTYAARSDLMITVRWTLTQADLNDSPTEQVRTLAGGTLAVEGVLTAPVKIAAGEDTVVNLKIELDKALVGRLTAFNNPGLVPVPRVSVR